MIGVVNQLRPLRDGAVKVLRRPAAERLVEDGHHAVLLDDGALQILLTRCQRGHHVVPVGDHRPEVGVPGGERFHHLGQVRDQRIEVVGVVGQRVGHRLQIDGQ